MKLRSLSSINRKRDDAVVKTTQKPVPKLKQPNKQKPASPPKSFKANVVELNTPALLKSMNVELKNCRVMLTRIDLDTDLLDLKLTRGLKVCLSERAKRVTKKSCMQAPGPSALSHRLRPKRK